MKLILTIDVEEDQWSAYSVENNTVENIERIVPLQTLLDRFGVRPTYLITYPVATKARSVEILRRIHDDGKCEIGAHCHPWNTPPFDGRESLGGRDTMLSNLSENLVDRKLSCLHETIVRNFGIAPSSFRAGRWGFGPAVGRSLCRLGYRTDTSVTPFVNWKEDHGPDYFSFCPGLFRFDGSGFVYRSGEGPLLEVPVTIGFLQPNFELCSRLMKVFERPWPKRLHTTGMLSRLRLLNRVWLSPEMTEVAALIRLSKSMMKNGYSYLNMTFHSPSLMYGLSPFVKHKQGELGFLQKIRAFLDYALAAGWEPMTLAEFEASGPAVKPG